MESLFQGKSVSLSYIMDDVRVEAIKQLDFEIETGKFTCLAGASGSGKSSLLNLLGFIEPLQQGQIKYRGQLISEFSEIELNRIRRFEIGFVFQSFFLIDVLTAEENVEYFLARQEVPEEKRKLLVRSALEWVGLADHAHKRPGQMSGGQRQRVAIARALAKQPKVILADEPTANLDSKTGSDILQLLVRLCREHGCTVIMASHDHQAINMADRVLRLRDGQLLGEK
ncbi:MAG: ABC transporter ATP-binding protein [Betaproteobacteria bacterium]|nr:ABC transporter ATP-binding protein [Betaproteobacteria bacterium]